MKQEKHIWQYITAAADLQDEPVPHQPLIEILSDRRVLIECHGGVMQYDSNQICVRVRFGHVNVLGSCLELTKMAPQQLIISGNIQCVKLEGKG